MAIDRKDALGLGAALAIPLVVGGLGGVSTARSIPTWYAALQKPSWNPPDWLFGPAWTILYVLMGVASWLVWRQARKGKAVGLALALYGIQLALNLGWSLIFFGARKPFWALVEIVPLWFFIAATMLQFYKVSKTAGALLIPYQLWVSFATALNVAVWRLNG
jgi:benzodiazapine receptor